TSITDYPNGQPVFKPPYGRITAINLRSGTHAWMKPLGDGPRSHPLLRKLKNLPKLGWWRRGWVLATKTLLLAVQAPGEESRAAAAKLRGHSLDVNFLRDERFLTAFDKRTGKLIAEVPLPSNATGSPMTYMVNGKQFVVIPIGGGDIPAEWVALTLPR